MILLLVCILVSVSVRSIHNIAEVILATVLLLWALLLPILDVTAPVLPGVLLWWRCYHHMHHHHYHHHHHNLHLQQGYQRHHNNTPGRTGAVTSSIGNNSAHSSNTVASITSAMLWILRTLTLTNIHTNRSII
jgi:hypothetical protein